MDTGNTSRGRRGGADGSEPGVEPSAEPNPPRDLDGTLEPFIDGSRSRRRPGDGAASASRFRSNLELAAQLNELRDELKKRQRHETVIREVRQGTTRPNSVKEIIREFQQVMVPTLAPQPPPQDNSQLIAALQQAVAHNQDLGRFAQEIGMSMHQLVAFMKAQPSQPGPPPPPPPLASSLQGC